MREPLSQVARGFVMGTADLVPGVSGGTMALVLGIYERLVAAIRQGAHALGRLVRLDLRGGIAALREVDWWFLLPLLAGILTAILALSRGLEHLLETSPVGMSAVFFGLILGSVPVAWGYLKDPRPVLYPLAGAVALIAFLALGLRGTPVEDASLLVAFGSGALAVCAMILPGISGSFILVMLGMYEEVIGAISGRDLPLIATVGLGATVGLALFSTALNWLLDRYHDLVLASLVGLMVGSLRVLWPWPHDLGGIEDVRLGAPVGGEVTLAVGLAGVAAAIMVVGGTVIRRRELGAEATVHPGDVAAAD